MLCIRESLPKALSVRVKGAFLFLQWKNIWISVIVMFTRLRMRLTMTLRYQFSRYQKQSAHSTVAVKFEFLSLTLAFAKTLLHCRNVSFADGHPGRHHFWKFVDTRCGSLSSLLVVVMKIRAHSVAYYLSPSRTLCWYRRHTINKYFKVRERESFCRHEEAGFAAMLLLLTVEQ